MLAPLPCQIIWVDSRKEVFPTAEQLPSNVQARVTDTPESEVASAPADSFFLLMSHTHEQDYRIGEAVFARDDVAYLGMIGSDRKRERLEQRLHALGYSAEALAQRLVCPIGIAGIDGRQPAEIAIAVAAQLLARRQLLKNHQ